MSRLRAFLVFVVCASWPARAAHAQRPPTSEPASGPQRLSQETHNRCRRPESDTARNFRPQFAQNRPLGCQRGFGFEGGPAATTFSSPNTTFASRTGLVLGSYVYWPLSDPWSFQPEIQYGLKGARSVGNGASTTLVLNYIEAPLFLRMSTTPKSDGRRRGSEVVFFGEAGPEVAVDLSCQASVVNASATQTSSCDAGTADAVASSDYGVIGGVGADLRMRRQVFTAVLRYDVGVKSISGGSDARNRAISMLFGIRW
ncbi:MAG TPA: porin family protein [Gemmatimonadaceae bacterium]|nr:porin family protein [Gemmatimonadaceae bacterium]